MQHPVIDGFKRDHNLTWKFITPRAPWQGGFYECLIGFSKLNLRKATYRCHPTYDEFVTLVREVECVVNDQPLTYLDVDDTTDTPLTPSHLLYGRTFSLGPQVYLADLTDPAFREGDILRNDYLKLTNMLQTFLKRWKYDYVSSLRERHQKSSCLHPTIRRDGDLCLLILDEVNQEEYPLTRILDVYPGRDGHIRTVKVRSANGEYVRPVNQLIPLEDNENTQTLSELSEEEPSNTHPLEYLDAPPRDQLSERDVGTTANAVSPVVIAAPRYVRPPWASSECARTLFQEIL
ncbi:uncharacterized protein [Palaemon carinicauda]|uniref:uncharacterized protein n=1 Tax=Palaemon carinicauda TaxID=392227 RepID=UPI0035B6607F